MRTAIYHTGGVFSYHLRLGWSQYMHKRVGASQGYHRVRVRVRVRVGVRVSFGGFLACCHGRWGGWWVLGGGVSMVICPTGVGIPLYPWQPLDMTVWAAR